MSEDDKKFALLEGLHEDYSIVKTILQHDAQLMIEYMVSRLESGEVEIDRKQNKT